MKSKNKRKTSDPESQRNNAKGNKKRRLEASEDQVDRDSSSVSQPTTVTDISKTTRSVTRKMAEKSTKLVSGDEAENNGEAIKEGEYLLFIYLIICLLTASNVWCHRSEGRCQ